MKLNALTRTLLAAGMLLAILPAQAETTTCKQAVEMSLAADPRIKEREQVVEAARGMLQEVQGNAGWRSAPMPSSGWRRSRGRFFSEPRRRQQYCNIPPCHTEQFRRRLERRFRLDPSGFRADQAALHFGKFERYGEAAQGNGRPQARRTQAIARRHGI